MCWKCGNNTKSIQIFRTTTCPSCGSDLHSCYNCKFYSSGSHYDCKETNADLVTDKERANFCDYFSQGPNSKNQGKSQDDKAKAAKDAFNALFGGGILCL